MDQRIRVLIADDHAGSRRGLLALLATRPTIEVVCVAENGREAVQQVEECQPDVVLMDIQMPEWDGLEATRHIKARWPEVKIIALTVRANYRPKAISAGVDAFLLKGCPSQELFTAIQCCGDPQSKAGASRTHPHSDTDATSRESPRKGRLTAVALTG